MNLHVCSCSWTCTYKTCHGKAWHVNTDQRMKPVCCTDWASVCTKSVLQIYFRKFKVNAEVPTPQGWNQWDRLVYLSYCWSTVFIDVDWKKCWCWLKSLVLITRSVRGLKRRDSGCLKGQVALSYRQVWAHLWHRGPEVSRQQQDSNPGPSKLSCPRQALYPTELPLTPMLEGSVYFWRGEQAKPSLCSPKIYTAHKHRLGIYIKKF